jgi:hypothetical protein
VLTICALLTHCVKSDLTDIRCSYRYAMLIVFANYLVEMKSSDQDVTFEKWIKEHREVTKLLEKRLLD